MRLMARGDMGGDGGEGGSLANETSRRVFPSAEADGDDETGEDRRAAVSRLGLLRLLEMRSLRLRILSHLNTIMQHAPLAQQPLTAPHHQHAPLAQQPLTALSHLNDVHAYACRAAIDEALLQHATPPSPSPSPSP